MAEIAKRGGKRATPPGHSKVFKTAIFKIHNPSRHKRAMLRSAMKHAHLGYEKLLDQFMPCDQEIKRLGELNKKERREYVNNIQPKVIKSASRLPNLSVNAKSGVRVEALAQIKSTLGLQSEQESVGLPTVPRINDSQPEYEAALEDIVRSSHLMEENRCKDELNTVAKMGTLRPLYFCRTDVTGGYVFLKHPDTGRYYAWLNLHGKDSRYAKKRAITGLVNMQDGEILTKTSKTGALFPLECGYAHHDLRFIEQGQPQTARLYHRLERNGKPCDDYELHVTFKYVVKKVEPTTWLGVDRGVYNLAAAVVVDDAGKVIESRVMSGMDLRYRQREMERRIARLQKKGLTTKGSKRRAWANEAVHVVSNQIVALAAECRSQVVLEDLKSLSAVRRKKRIPGKRRGGFNRLLGRVQYEKLRKVLEYKLPLAGLPYPVLVRAARTSQTCPECSKWSRDNRVKKPTSDGFQMDKFKCVECGFKANADLNAARVIAMKGHWLTGLPKKSERKKEPLPDALNFEKFLKDCAERRIGA